MLCCCREEEIEGVIVEMRHDDKLSANRASHTTFAAQIPMDKIDQIKITVIDRSDDPRDVCVTIQAGNGN